MKTAAAIYARVSTDDQDCALQLTELRGYCKRQGWQFFEYIDKASGKQGARRPKMDEMMKDANFKRFDVVIVWKLDRFGRSLQDLIANIQTLELAHIRFIALTQNIDTDIRTPTGRLLFHIMGAFAEFERDLIVERTKAGMAEAKRQGVHVGRPLRLFHRERAREMRVAKMSWSAIAKEFNVSVMTVRRAVLGNEYGRSVQRVNNAA